MRLAQVVPAREAWLYKNRKALESVRRGIEGARARRFSPHPPDLDADRAIVDELADG